MVNLAVPVALLQRLVDLRHTEVLAAARNVKVVGMLGVLGKVGPKYVVLPKLWAVLDDAFLLLDDLHVEQIVILDPVPEQVGLNQAIKLLWHYKFLLLSIVDVLEVVHVDDCGVVVHKLPAQLLAVSLLCKDPRKSVVESLLFRLFRLKVTGLFWR